MFSVFVIFAISAIVWCGGYDKGDFNILQGHGRPKREPPPPYLGSVTEQARNEYFAIMSNMNQTIAQQKQNVLIWAQKNGIEKQVQEYDSVMTKLRNELKNNITNFVSQLPSAAQQYAALMVDENQTSAEQFKKLQDLCSQNPQQCSVLRVAMEQFKPRQQGDIMGQPMMEGQGGPEGHNNYRPQWNSNADEQAGNRDHGMNPDN